LLGRNLDRRDIPVLAKFAAPGKYASFAFSPSIEVHLRDVLDVAQPTETQKNNFLFALPFYPTDGINEKGLAIGIAGAPLRRVKRSDIRQPMFVLLFIRRVLDNCQNVEEVARFAETVDLYDRALDTISHHFLVMDAGGNWLVIDYPDGSLRLTRGQGEPLVRTNHFVEGGPSSADTRTSFSRYDKLYEALNSGKSLASDYEAMALLKRVCDNTAWSVVYESRARRGLLAVRENYRTQYRFGFPQVKE
jgi:choloylglycine hydrolase